MEDRQIIDLFWKRSQNAISETAKKYEKYCYYIAFNILHSICTGGKWRISGYFPCLGWFYKLKMLKTTMCGGLYY